jgi:protein TIF31
MAGKSNKGKAKGKGKHDSGSAPPTVPSKEVQPLTGATGLPELVLKKAPAVPAAVEQLAVEAPKEEVAEALAESPKVETPAAISETVEGADVSEAASTEVKESKPEEAETHDVNGDGDGDGDGDADGDAELLLFPITVKGPSGEQLELQVNPGDSVMDLRQFLLDAPETCFYTCYDLILNAADGVKYHLAE